VNNTIKADAAFLRRVFLALVFVTTISGVQAMNARGDGSCLIFCN
jgi:hypothetical protein